MSIVDRGTDEPDAVVSLDHDQAVAVAALLTGARFSLDTRQDDRIDADEVAPVTVTLGPRSPVVGALPADVVLPGDGGAGILAVIRDEPADLVEEEPVEPYRAGDRLVVAVRRDRIDDLARQLAG